MSVKTKTAICFFALVLMVIDIKAVSAETLQPSLSAQDKQEVLKLLDKAPDKPKEPEFTPKTINDFANQYYKSCIEQEDPTLQGENLELMCSCTSAQIPQNMTVQQMRAMRENTEEGEYQRGRMLLFVYTPCIEYPIRARVKNSCLEDRDIKKSISNYKKVCKCLSDGVVGFIKERAPKQAEYALQYNMKDIDLLSMLLESTAYRESKQHHMNKCVRIHSARR